MIENLECANLDLKAKDYSGRTGLNLAEDKEQTDVIHLIKRKIPHISRELVCELSPKRHRLD